MSEQSVVKSGIHRRFYSLFRRSRHLQSLPLLSKGKNPREERERFAGAMLAFCLEHDRQFREYFMEKVCGWDKSEPILPLTISVEDEDWADLRIETDPLKYAWVIECKITANLEDHQNPDKNAFVITKGYGKQIKDHYSQTTVEEVTYVVLGAKMKVNATSVQQLHVRESKWRALKDSPTDHPALFDDFLTTLGLLRVSEFTYRATEHFMIRKHIGEATEVVEVLRNVAEELRLDPDNWDLSAADKYIGLNIRRGVRKGIPDALAAQLSTEPDAIGWFGYQSDKPYVWFYCNDSKKCDKLEPLLKNQPGKIEREDDSIGIYLDAKSSDQDWFINVLKAIFPSR